MKKKNYMLGIFLLGIFIFSLSFGFAIAPGDDGPEEPIDEEPIDEEPVDEEPVDEEPVDEEPVDEEPVDEEPIDEDKDGIDDEIEEKEKRNICIWFGENVVEMASIRRHGNQKDILELRIGYKDHGLAVRVSFGTIIKSDNPEEPEEPVEKDIEPHGGDEEEWTEYKLEFEAILKGFIEFVDLNNNGVFDHEIDEFIEDYGINSFQPIAYTLQPISDDSNLHYFLLTTTDGVFTAHIYFVEEFVYVDETLITPTQVKIDIEITNFNYIDDSSQLALFTILRSETENDAEYEERDETIDEKAGIATDGEKEVFINNDIYTGVFSWKETALVDGVEMSVYTNRLEVDEEHPNCQKLLINYPRGNHIYHDPKIGISIAIEDPLSSIVPIITAGTVFSVIGVAVIASVFFRKRRIK